MTDTTQHQAPRVKPSDLELAIRDEIYFTAEQGVFGATRMRSGIPELSLTTCCVLVLRNGYTVMGLGRSPSQEDFEQREAKRIARENAVREILPLLGYQLREKLHRAGAAG